MSQNPFEAPESNDTPPEELGETLTPMYSPASIAGTTFLGSPLAGSVLVVANAHMLGRSKLEPALYCGGFCVAYVVLAMVLPEATPGVVFAVGGMFALRGINQMLYHDAIALRQAEGTPWAPWWHGLLIGLAVLIPIVMLFLALLVAIDAGY